MRNARVNNSQCGEHVSPTGVGGKLPPGCIGPCNFNSLTAKNETSKKRCDDRFDERTKVLDWRRRANGRRKRKERSMEVRIVCNVHNTQKLQ